MKPNFKRVLGRSGIEVSPMGMGCWAIGGPLTMQGMNLGWGNVDDAESKRALQKAYEMGVNFFDTADVYGGGHSEKLIGEVLSKHREKIVLATKFGMSFEGRAATGLDGSTVYMEKAVEASLKRLKTDYIDLYQFHIADFPHEDALKTRDALEKLVETGKIRGYAWSTDKPENTLLPEDDCRFAVEHYGDPYYLFFRGGKAIPELLEKLNAIKEILQSKGRSLAQGALASIWAKSEVTIPIPGFKTVKQVEENAGAIEYGPLSPDQMGEIEKIFNSLK